MDSTFDNLINLETLESQINEDTKDCVICLQPIITNDISSRFTCGHERYIHNACDKKLKKCPLCRELSHDVISGDRMCTRRATQFGRNFDEKFGYIFISVVIVAFILVLAISIYPIYMWGIYSNNITNTTNTTNTTNIPNITI